MKKLNQIAVLLAAIAAIGTSFAATPSAGNNWLGANGEAVWKNSDNTLCWQDSFWTPATAASIECGKPAPEPEPAPEPVVIVVPEPAPEPAPEPVVVVVAEQVRYAAEALFNFDKSALKPEGEAILQDLVSKMNALNLEVVLAKGYTDSTGPAEYNMGLSNRRADSVKAYLVSLGVPANAITTEGFGENDPVASNKTRAGRAQNRRVEIEVVGTPR